MRNLNLNTCFCSSLLHLLLLRNKDLRYRSEAIFLGPDSYGREAKMNSLLQRYRNDRCNLLEFLMSSGLVTELRSPSGSPASLSPLFFFCKFTI
ncbi:hypothetical protein CARUB_v10002341mg [Capsella rubella]|uniref:Uncharacterized protein n=1 Tax=Capsella rubella TaxID=81985 RepID=R0HA45_9BRAS|nr:hypothetical protein CARUB_v10002341mg [Capsella rubella]